jgi:MFS transporter, DHA2 family, metal-tetracycline-proton antiporter
MNPPSAPAASAEAALPDARQATWTLALLATVVFFSVVNGTMVNVALPFIGRHFDVTEGTYGWIVTGNALAFGIFNAIHGRLADLIGLRRLYLFGIAVLGAGSLAVAIAPTIEIAIAVRVIQGAGSAAIPVLGATIIARSFPAARRGAAMGYVLGSVGLAASVGPFLGGIIVQLAGWRAVFAFTGIILLAIPVALRLLPSNLDARTKAPFDYPGALWLGAGVTALIYSFNVLEQQGFGLTFYGLIAAGLAGLLLFWIRIQAAPHPFAHPAIFKNARFLATAAVAFLSNATRFGSIVLVPIFLIEVNELAPIWVGIVLLPGALMIALTSPATGRYADRVGARKPATIGMLLILAGNIVTAYYAGVSPLGVAFGMLLYGQGFAFTQSPLVSAVSSVLPREQAGVGMGMFMMIFFLGGAFGVALSVTTVELQALGAVSWLGWEMGGGAIYSNAVLTLTLLAAAALPALKFVPGK